MCQKKKGFWPIKKIGDQKSSGLSHLNARMKLNELKKVNVDDPLSLKRHRPTARIKHEGKKYKIW